MSIFASETYWKTINICLWKTICSYLEDNFLDPTGKFPLHKSGKNLIAFCPANKVCFICWRDFALEGYKLKTYTSMLVGNYGHNWRVLSNSAFFRSVKVYSNKSGIEDQHTAARFRWLLGSKHKVLTFIEYRAVSGVFRTIDPPPSAPICSKCVLPPHQRRGDTHSQGGEGVGGQYFGRRQTLDWLLTV
jgi:hypothetical protein